MPDGRLQRCVWAISSSNLGGAGGQRGEVRIKSPRLSKGAGGLLPFRDVIRGMDPLFFDGLALGTPFHSQRRSYASIMSNSLQPSNIMKLSAEFSKGKLDRAEDEDFDSAPQCFTIYCSILFSTAPLEIQTRLYWDTSTVCLAILYGIPF